MTPRRSRNVLAGSFLLLAPLAIYLPLRSAGFVWDDDQYVTQNRHLQDLAGLLRIWLDPRAVPQYYPLVHTSYWAEFQLWGLDARGYHLVNVLLHAGNALLLWRLLLRLRVPGALFAAALFAVHPVMTESVAWITERKNVLSLALALGSFAVYLRAAPPAEDADSSAAGRRLHAVAFLLYVGALLSKTVVCVLPAAILVVRWWKRGRIRASDVVPLVPYFVLGAAAGLHTAWLERQHVGAVGADWSLDPLERVLLAGRALWFYAGKLVWPDPLVFFYPRWRIDASEPWQLAFPLAFAATLVALWAARRRIGRGPLAAVLLFAGILFPALGFFDVYPFRYSYVADHFQYHASPALLALFAAASARLVVRRGSLVRVAAGGAAIALLVALGALANARAHAFHDLETLYRDTIAKNPSAWNAYLNLANHLSSTGRNEEAVPLAREAARLAPHVADASNTLGAVLFLSAAGRPADAAARADEAIEAFARALALDPGHTDALYNGAVALTATGRHDAAARYYERLIELDPNSVDARVGLGRSLLMLERPELAEAPLREALRLAPERTDASQALAIARARRAAAAPEAP